MRPLVDTANTLRSAYASDEAAVLALLRAFPGLEVAFEAREFTVVDRPAGIVGCARLRRYADGAWELASVAVAKELQGTGIGARLVERALAPAGDAPVWALALAPGFFAKQGFRVVDASALPEGLSKKASGLCAKTGFVAMLRQGCA